MYISVYKRPRPQPSLPRHKYSISISFSWLTSVSRGKVRGKPNLFPAYFPRSPNYSPTYSSRPSRSRSTSSPQGQRQELSVTKDEYRKKHQTLHQRTINSGRENDLPVGPCYLKVVRPLVYVIRRSLFLLIRSRSAVPSC